ncbi:MAG TPA: hypothetical protein V6D21_19425 [Candidatus Obscuribacterales bacterium]
MKTNFQHTSTPLSELTTNEPENEMNQELNDFELDAIAGGKFNWRIYLQSKGIDLTKPVTLIPLN